MKTGPKIVLALLAGGFCLWACSSSGKGRVIPENRMVDLYVDMFVSDAWLKDNKDAKARADTTLFFDPIFKRHGYTFDDYEKSIQFYSGDMETFSKILDSAARILSARSAELEKKDAAILRARHLEDSLRAHWVDFVGDSVLLKMKGCLSLRRDDSGFVYFPTAGFADSLQTKDSVAADGSGGKTPGIPLEIAERRGELDLNEQTKK